MNILKRRSASGFVKYPKDFEKRTVDGCARFRTKCDMIVGPCACGRVHQECEHWVQEMLLEHNAEFEPLLLAMDDEDRVMIPRYWIRPFDHQHCTALVGQCACGRVHTADESWVRLLVTRHCAKIAGEDIEPINVPDAEITLDNSGGASMGCPCPRCMERRRSALLGSELRRDAI
jgi:hypothetical protein